MYLPPLTVALRATTSHNPYIDSNRMTIFERAAQIWPALAWAAHNRQVITYNILSQLTGMPRQGLGQCLEPIQSYCLVKNLPPLTILAVSQDSGMPGVGFIAAVDIPATQMQVFTFDWLEHRCPPVEAFQSAAEEHASNEQLPLPELEQVTA